MIVKALAPSEKTTLSTCTEAESEMAVVLEKAKVAISDGPFGIVAGDQLVAVFQLPLAGLDSQVALPACELAERPRQKSPAIFKRTDR